jgi:hypothetical protein
MGMRVTSSICIRGFRIQDAMILLPQPVRLDDHLQMFAHDQRFDSSDVTGQWHLAKWWHLAVSMPKGPSRAQVNMEFACRSSGTAPADLHVSIFEPATG